MAVKGPVEFKGKLNGLFLNLDQSATFDRIMAHLDVLLSERGEFYKGSKIVGLKGQTLNYRQLGAIEALITENYGIEVESLEDPDKRDMIVEKIVEKVVEKVVEVEKPVVEKVVIPSAPQKMSDTHFVFGTLRSGKSVHYPGHVVVIGDVNPGAEIVAEGNIIVMGRVLGFIHAGSAGNDQAVIIASLLKPTQIRISTYISVPPSDDESIHTTVPEKATVHNGVIKIEKCH